MFHDILEEEEEKEGVRGIWSRNIAESKKNISYTFHQLNILKICDKVSLIVLISFEKGRSGERGLEVILISALDSNVKSTFSLFS